MPFSAVPFDVAPFRFSGNVYGTLLNQRNAVAAIGPAAAEAPYNGLPKAVVLYVKPRNTLAGPGDAIAVPEDAAELELGASIGLVIGRTACRLAEAEALDHLAGYVIVGDVGVPHTSFYRPSIRFKARDGFCPIGPRVVPTCEVADPHALTLSVFVDGQLVQRSTSADLVRPIPRLLAEVTDFMTLVPGDVLMIGVAASAPRVRAGQRTVIEVGGLGRLENRFVADAEVGA